MVVVTSLLIAGTAFAGLWLGWTARDKAGRFKGEESVGPIGSPEKLEEPTILEDYSSKDLDEDGEDQEGF